MVEPRRGKKIRMITVLVTGAAGFVGFLGVDNLNDYYDVQLKRDRLAQIAHHPTFTFQAIELADRAAVDALFKKHTPKRVIHLAAQPGVRYSLENPHAYIDSNVTSFLNVLEGCRHHRVEHLVYASSSSVYGANRTMPFSVHQNVDHPVSLYAATKKANELMAHTYSHLYQIPTTGLRFFTVYGPWGRPDMALFRFTKAILEGNPIDVYNHGRMRRDFTYIDDITDGVVRVLNHVPMPNLEWSGHQPDPGTSNAPYRIYNIGNNQSVELLHFIQVLEHSLGIQAQKNLLPLQPGDVLETYADIDDLTQAVGYQPKTSIEEGIPQFVRWYREYYQVKGVRNDTHQRAIAPS
jgi:UDP-glucuronate 4-epimerase